MIYVCHCRPIALFNWINLAGTTFDWASHCLTWHSVGWQIYFEQIHNNNNNNTLSNFDIIGPCFPFLNLAFRQLVGAMVHGT